MKSTTVNALHDATHRVPGVPAHDSSRNDAAAQGANHHHGMLGRTSRRHNPAAHHQAPPRVLISWQNWIATLLRRNS
jgi:hypothetical protein